LVPLAEVAVSGVGAEVDAEAFLDGGAGLGLVEVLAEVEGPLAVLEGALFQLGQGREGAGLVRFSVYIVKVTSRGGGILRVHRVVFQFVQFSLMFGHR
jgi:hypothetical protein